MTESAKHNNNNKNNKNNNNNNEKKSLLEPLFAVKKFAIWDTFLTKEIISLNLKSL